MYNKPETQPTATCSTMALNDNIIKHVPDVPTGKENAIDENDDDDTIPTTDVLASGKKHANNSILSDVSNTLAKKSKLQHMSKSDKCHSENLERKDRFLELFSKLVDKL